MTPKQQRIAIAEACGLKDIKKYEDVWICAYSERRDCLAYGNQPLFGIGSEGYYHEIPDYLNDLNAMHEAEEQLDSPQSIKYANELTHVSRHNESAYWEFYYIHATAAQRAEAFLRTTGKWKY